MIQAGGQFDELGLLASGLCEGQITFDEAARLEFLVGKSAAARRFFVNYVQLHGELCWELAAAPAAAPRASRRRWRIAAIAAVAASLLAAVSSSVWWWAQQPAAAPAVAQFAPTVEAGRAGALEARPAEGAATATVPLAARARGTGSVARMRAIVARHPSLIHHYTFEGATAREKCADKRGSLHLTEAVMVSGRGLHGVKFGAAGLDASTSVLEPSRAGKGGNSRGAGLQSQAVFTPPADMTIELLLRFTGGADDDEPLVAAAVATREDRRRCGFLVAAADRGQLVHLLDAEADWLADELEFTPGDWYYLAVTLHGEAGRTRINAYAANVSRGQAALGQVVKDRTLPGVVPASRLGIGKGFNAEVAHAYPWPGALDEVAIYDGILGTKELQEHLASLFP